MFRTPQTSLYIPLRAAGTPRPAPHSPPPSRKWAWHAFFLLMYNWCSNFTSYGECAMEYLHGYFMHTYSRSLLSFRRALSPHPLPSTERGCGRAHPFVLQTLQRCRRGYWGSALSPLSRPGVSFPEKHREFSSWGETESESPYSLLFPNSPQPSPARAPVSLQGTPKQQRMQSGGWLPGRGER